MKIAIVALAIAAAAAIPMSERTWMNELRNDPPDVRAKALVAKMNLTEKITMLHGPASGPCCQCKTSPLCAYVGNVAPNPGLGIPPITMNDGPQGFRDNSHPGTSTAWPSGLNIAATWDVAAASEWGTGMGKEFFAKGANVQLGPGLCVARVPRNGRNFEYLSGEDPFLGYTLVQPVIKGIQGQGVIANAKHYINNNQETNRGAVSENVDERTRFEIYYGPFRGAVEAGVGSVMCSYNKINGNYSCENPDTLGQDLKQREGFTGWVMSDWGATHSMSINAGLDQEMPGAKFMNEQNIEAAVKSGAVKESTVDESVVRILTPMFQVGVMDAPAGTWDWKKQASNSTSEASCASARSLAAKSTVLLKNDGGILPLPKSGKKFALLGLASDNCVVHGGGSGSVVPSYISTPLSGISDAVGAGSVTYNDGKDTSAAAAAAKAADVAIVFVATLSHEGGDRASLSLDDGGPANNQNALVAAVAAAQPNTVVVVTTPGAILMPRSKSVKAIVTNFLPGQQAGNAIADVLFGAVNPGAKLPLTMPNKENEVGFTTAQWPGLPPSKPLNAEYTEKLNIGYRYYDTNSIQFDTGFPFGHGLSYTTFSYSGITASADSVSVKVTNTGKIAGAEVAQLYLGFPASAGEPPKLLKGFQKLDLQPGASATATFALKSVDKSIWDVSSHGWKAVSGTFTAMVGSSSRDIRLNATFTA